MTETWIKTTINLEKIYEDITKSQGLDIIYYNRPGRRKGGGVAVVFDKRKIVLEEHKFRRDGIEIVAAKGHLVGHKRKLFIICIYLPPNLLRSRVNHACDLINTEIDRIRTLHDSPLILLGGDFNQFGIRGLHRDCPEITELPSPATRGDLRLDLLSCNFPEYLIKTDTLLPLESAVNPSDHNILVANFDIPHRHTFKLITYKTRKKTRKGTENLINAINELSWTCMEGINDSTTMVEIFQGKINALIDKYMPYKTRKVKSTDDPWIRLTTLESLLG